MSKTVVPDVPAVQVTMNVHKRLSCPLCGFVVLHGTGTPVVYRCTGDIWSSHAPIMLTWDDASWPDGESYEAWYASSAYHDEEQVAGGQKPYTSPMRYSEAARAAIARWAVIRAVLGEGNGTNNAGKRRRTLDVGSGCGAFVHVLRAYEQDAYGIDPHPIHRNNELDCERGTWEDVKGQFDLITLHDVLEHVLRPAACLEHLRGCLATGGVLVIEMPEFEAPNQAWRKHIRVRQHPYLFSRGAAESLYDSVGLETIGFYRPLRASIGKMSHILMRRERERENPA